MANVKNWVVQESGTVGTGNITLGAIVQGFAGFAQAFQGPTEVWYSLEDNGNREAGIGNFDGGTILARTQVMATLINGVYNDTTPQAISLSGEATVSCTYNKVAFDRGFNQTEIGTTPPVNPQPDDLWWDSETGAQFIWYDDGTSQQWVQTSKWASGVAGEVVTPGLYVLSTLYATEVGDVTALTTATKEVVAGMNEINAATTGAIKSDGSVEMDGGYVPADNQDVATKFYVDSGGGPAVLPIITTEDVGVSVSTVAQEPPTPLQDETYQINFGAGFSTPDMTLAANGDITIGTTDQQFEFRYQLNVGRQGGGGGQARMIFWSTINGTPSTESLTVALRDTDDQQPLYVFSTFSGTAGDVIRIFAVRDGGAGAANEGGLYPVTPNDGAVPPTPSAKITINKLVTTTPP